MTAYEKVRAARAKDRPTAMRYIERIFEDFTEMHGDRRYADDQAVVAGLAMLDDCPVTVIGVEKGKDVAERVKRNFGSAHPDGYRKALRQMKLAEKFGRPVICMVDTSGAFCGVSAEERGQGLAIAENMYELTTLKVPVVSVIIGEGGSGGALALAVADEVWMLENSVYSVISPEGAASIIWKDAKKAEEASECLKITADDMLAFGVIERIIREEDGFDSICTEMKTEFLRVIEERRAMGVQKMLEARYEKYRRIGGETS